VLPQGTAIFQVRGACRLAIGVGPVRVSLAAVTPDSLRVMTANLWSWHCEPSGLADVLRDQDPDVLAVQELHWGCVEVIKHHFPHNHLDPHHETLGTGIAARRAFAVERLPVTYRGGWIAKLDSAAWPHLPSPIEVVNVHFANPVGWPWTNSYRVRRRQLDVVAAHISSTRSRTVVVGDFNASPAWPVYREMARRMTDSAVEAGTVLRTWRFRGMTPPLLRIDHAFVKDARGVRTWTVEVPGADHLALVADIAFS